RFGDRVTRILVVEGLARVAVARGNPVKALQLFEVADAQRRRLGVLAAPAIKALVDPWRLRAREALSESEMAAAVAAGRAMQVEDALAEALDSTSGDTLA